MRTRQVRQILAVGIAAIITIMISGCADNSSEHSTVSSSIDESGIPDNPDRGFRSARVDTPPAAPPSVKLSSVNQRITIDPVIVKWSEDSARQGDPNNIQWTPAPNDWAGDIELSQDNHPFEVVVSRYKSVDTKGIPTGTASRWKCGRGAEECNFPEGLGSDMTLSLSPALTKDYKYYVVQIIWTDQRSGSADKFMVIAVEYGQ